MVPQDRDWETDTKHAVNVVKRKELTSSSMGNVMVNPRNLEIVVSQRQYFQSPVLILVPGRREQIHDAFQTRRARRMQPPEIVDMLWKGVGKLESHKAPGPRQRSKNGHVWFVATEGPPLLNEISLLNGKVFLTRDVMQGREKQNKVRPSVWTKIKEEKGSSHFVPRSPRSFAFAFAL